MAAARELPRRFDTLAAWEQFRGELRRRLPAVIGRPEFPPLRESVTRARVQVGKDVICERVDVHVDAEGARGCDLIALPETWMGQADHDPEELAGSDRHPDERAGAPPLDLHRVPYRSDPGNDRSDRGNTAAEHRGPDRPPGEDRRQLRQGVSPTGRSST